MCKISNCFTLGQNVENSVQLISGNVTKEFNLKSNLRSKRKCNALAWNPTKPALLAAGYDSVIKQGKATQHSIAIWDVNKEAKVTQEHFGIFAPYSSDALFKDDFNYRNPRIEHAGLSKKKKAQIVKEQYSLLNKKDDSTALTWIEGENDKLISGSLKGSVRLYDLQGSSPIEFVSHKKKIFSIKVSPFNSHIFASGSEDQLKIFDKRKNKQALLQINHDIQDFEFSTNLSYVLATIHSRDESDTVKFWNISSSLVEQLASPEIQTVDLKYPFTTHRASRGISSLCWCPKIVDEYGESENKYLLVSDNGALNEEKYKVIDTMPIDFSNSNTLAFTNDDKIFFYNFMNQNVDEMNEAISKHKNGAVDSGDVYEPETDLDDISELMIRRLNCKYGLDINHNIELSEHFSNTGINVVWRWLKEITEDHKKTSVRKLPFNDNGNYYQGIAHLLG